jgi:hypothetical protein
MLIDALRRRAETYWLWIIVGVPGGSLLYFFVVRLRARDARMLQGRIVQSLRKPPSIRVLEERYAESPSVAHRIALAQGLADAERWAEAKVHFSGVLEKRPAESDALFGLGICELELGRFEAAVVPLEQLVDAYPNYRDYSAFAELAQALERAGRTEASIDLLEELVRRSPRLRHVVLLAEYLVRAGRRTEAKEHLHRALRDHREAPRHVRREGRPWARKARQMLDAR